MQRLEQNPRLTYDPHVTRTSDIMKRKIVMPWLLLYASVSTASLEWHRPAFASTPRSLYESYPGGHETSGFGPIVRREDAPAQAVDATDKLYHTTCSKDSAQFDLESGRNATNRFCETLSKDKKTPQQLGWPLSNNYNHQRNIRFEG